MHVFEKKRIYGRRKGRPLGSHRKILMDQLLPQIRIHLPELGQLYPETIINEKQALWLEIGFGNGEHLVDQALRHPDVNIIGCDVFENAVASLLKKIEQKGIQNIQIFDDDARKLVDTLADASIDRIFILFPDPWPKVRHHKRRIMQSDFLEALARILKLGGMFRFASDIDDYIDQVLELVQQQKTFQIPSGNRTDWQKQPDDWVETKYEQRGKRLGHVCHYLDFFR